MREICGKNGGEMTHECTLKEAYIIKALDEIQPDWRTGTDVRRETKDKIRERVAKKYADIFDPNNSACITIRSIEATVKRIRDKLDITALRDRSKDFTMNPHVHAGSSQDISDSPAPKPEVSSDVQATSEPSEPAEPHEPSEPSEPGEPSIESDSGKGLESGQEQQQEPEEEREPEKEQEQHQEPEEIAEKEPREETEKEPEGKQEPEEEQELTQAQIVSEPSESISESKTGLESNEKASQPQEEAQEQAETPDVGGEDTKPSKETYEKMFGGTKTAEGKESQLARKTSTSDVKPERTKSEPEKPPLKIPDDYTPETIFQCLSCYERFEIQQNTACPFCRSKKIIESAFDKLPCDYTPRKKADKQDTDEDDEELKYWQELIDKNSIDTPADYKTANEVIKYFQKIELETSGGYPLEYEKRFAYNGGKYRVVAFGVNNDERGRDGILGIIFVKE